MTGADLIKGVYEEGDISLAGCKYTQNFYGTYYLYEVSIINEKHKTLDISCYCSKYGWSGVSILKTDCVHLRNFISNEVKQV